MRKLIAWSRSYSLEVFLLTKAPSIGSFVSACPANQTETSKNLTFTRARTRTSWAAPPTRPWPGLPRLGTRALRPAPHPPAHTPTV